MDTPPTVPSRPSGFSRAASSTNGCWRGRVAWTASAKIGGWGFDGDVRVTREDRYETLMGGLRSPSAEGWVGFYYQLLAGGFRIARTMTYESDTVDIGAENARCGRFGGDGRFHLPCDPPFPAGETAYGFALQPGVGVEFWGPDFDVPFIQLVELGLRVAADLPIVANRDHVEVRPRLAVMLVVGFGP